MNLNDSAAALYIHRNTLLYRLDKIKQETGADVRSFGDAAIVKLAMLLYKVTKRK
ncbi:Leucine-rich protein [compost metagenome]